MLSTKLLSGVLFHRHLNVQRRFLTALISDDGKFVFLQEANKSDEEKMKFPSIWLRDNCQCSDCFHSHTLSRKINWEALKMNTNIKAIKVDKPKKLITIDWQDRHQSTYTLEWLRNRNFTAASQERYLQTIYKPVTNLWSKSDFSEVDCTFQYDDVKNDDGMLLKWIQAIAHQGFAFIRNAPKDRNVVRTLADRIGFIKRTTYGEEFEVKAKPNAKNYAYLMTPLPLHTDMPYYDYKPGINILHCLVQSNSEGGANLITDGFYIAERLRLDYPSFYETLTKTPVNWYDLGEDVAGKFHMVYRAPVICLDIDGRYQRINHNTTKRDSFFTIPPEKVEAWYEAFDKFLELANSEAVEVKINAGDVFTFNNLRILHGRTAYFDSTENTRHLIGAYVDWDIIYSRMRILLNEFKR